MALPSLLIGLDYLHEACKIIHTDLKPENVLIAGVHGKFGKTVVNDLPSLRAVYRVSKAQKQAKGPDAMSSEQKEETGAGADNKIADYDLVDMRLSKAIKEYEAIVAANPVDKSGNLKSGSTISAEERKRVKKKIKKLKARRARRRLKQLQEEGFIQQKPNAAADIAKKNVTKNKEEGENHEDNGWHVVRKRSSRKLKDVRQSKTFSEVVVASNFRDKPAENEEAPKQEIIAEITAITSKNELQKYLSPKKATIEVRAIFF